MHETKKHPFHIVDLSIWPITTSFSLLILAAAAVMLMHHYHTTISYSIFALGSGSLLYSLYGWWKDVIKEAIYEKQHSNAVRSGLKIGVALFILSEITLFASFFGSFFYAELLPLGILEGVWVTKEGAWPPSGIQTFDPWSIPFMNTLILLLSGTTVTWAHYSFQENNQKDGIRALLYTILLGIFFSSMQALEYFHAPFKFTDGVYASNFYLATGLHGIHVIIGTIFLTVCYFRARKGHFASPNHYLGFDFAAWYWHFVDVVWLFLFIFIYVLGR